MYVNGQNNRVAGRDYYEKPIIELTPEQLTQLAIRPCSRCETRFISPGAKICNHCCKELQDKKAQEYLSLFFVSVLVVFGGLLKYSQQYTDHITFSLFIQLGVAAIALVIGVVIIGFMLYAIWQEYHSH